MTMYSGIVVTACRSCLLRAYLIRYRVHEIGQPYVTYTIRVTLQQLDFKNKTLSKNGTTESVWRTIGTAYVGPQTESHNIPEMIKGNSSSPEVMTAVCNYSNFNDALEQLPENSHLIS